MQISLVQVDIKQFKYRTKPIFLDQIKCRVKKWVPFLRSMSLLLLFAPSSRPSYLQLQNCIKETEQTKGENIHRYKLI